MKGGDDGKVSVVPRRARFPTENRPPDRSSACEREFSFSRAHLAGDGIVQRGQTLGEDGQIALDLGLLVLLIGDLLVDFLALLAEVLDACVRGRRDAGKETSEREFVILSRDRHDEAGRKATSRNPRPASFAVVTIRKVWRRESRGLTTRTRRPRARRLASFKRTSFALFRSPLENK